MSMGCTFGGICCRYSMLETRKFNNLTYINEKKYNKILKKILFILNDHIHGIQTETFVNCIQLFHNMRHKSFRNYDIEFNLLKKLFSHYLDYENNLIHAVINNNLFKYCDKKIIDIIISYMTKLKYNYYFMNICDHTYKRESPSYKRNILNYTSIVQLNYMLHNNKIYNLVKQNKKDKHNKYIDKIIEKYHAMKEIFIKDIFIIIYNFMIIICH